jgi:beta-mannosidase
MYRCELGKGWQLRHEEIYFDRDHFATVISREAGWLDVPSLPCDVRVPLIAAGLIEDPVVADNYLRSEWIENKSWWFKKTFTAGDDLLRSQTSELVIDGLDVKADLFLNGTHLGHHASAMYPFRKDVRDLLHAGENLLVVRVTSGLEYVSNLDLAKIGDHISAEFKRGRGPRGDYRRVFLRKPQYVYGWDWNPRIASCGIMGAARIEAYGITGLPQPPGQPPLLEEDGIEGNPWPSPSEGIAIRDLKFTTDRLTAERACVRIEVEIDNLHPIDTLDATVGVEIRFADLPVHSAEKDAFLTSGVNYISFEACIADPKPWWPNGLGEQNLYSLEVWAHTPAGLRESRRLSVGIRTIKLNMDKVAAGGRLFAFEINGVRTFCKGGNWETPDSVYGRIPDAKYEALVKEAQLANFNMFRMNGVNAYERDYFYDCCDRHGIMLWQDFDFSCAAYPDEVEWFRRESEREIDYQTRRLRNHPSVVLWCGNNECQVLMAGGYGRHYWAGDTKPASPGGTLLYNESMPRIIRANSPDIPYWNSSPYGGVGDLQSTIYGDRHHWYCFMNADMTRRITPEEYDRLESRFVSEFGCVGPTKKSSLLKYYGSDAIDTTSAIWKVHTNTFEKGAVREAIRKHFADPDALSLDGYLLYAGLFQGLTLGYALDSMRCAPHNYGALIWSYCDCWGEVGWSIIDYYVTRKISYYFVKRALAPKRLILREQNGVVNVLCANDTRARLQFDLECGYVTFDGRRRESSVTHVTVEPSAKAAIIAGIPRGAHDVLTGVFYARADGDPDITPATWRGADFRDLQIERPTLTISATQPSGSPASFVVSSATYAHAVHFGLDDQVRLSDEYFDLLPGESRQISILDTGAPGSLNDIRPRYVFVQPL